MGATNFVPSSQNVRSRKNKPCKLPYIDNYRIAQQPLTFTIIKPSTLTKSLKQQTSVLRPEGLPLLCMQKQKVGYKSSPKRRTFWLTLKKVLENHQTTQKGRPIQFQQGRWTAYIDGDNDTMEGIFSEWDDLGEAVFQLSQHHTAGKPMPLLCAIWSL